MLLDPTLEAAKGNAELAVGKMVGGGALLAAAVGLTQGARLVEHLGRHTAIRWWALGAVLAAVAASWGIWLWRRTVGLRRLAASEPQLHGIYVALARDPARRGGRLRRILTRRR